MEPQSAAISSQQPSFVNPLDAAPKEAEAEKGANLTNVSGKNSNVELAANVDNIAKSPEAGLTHEVDNHAEVKAPIGNNHQLQPHAGPQNQVELSADDQKGKIADNIPPAGGGAVPKPSKEYAPPPAAAKEKGMGSISKGITSISKDPFHVTHVNISQLKQLQGDIAKLREDAKSDSPPPGVKERLEAKTTQLAEIRAQLKPFLQNPTEFGKLIDSNPESALELLDHLPQDGQRDLIGKLINSMSSSPDKTEPGKVSQQTVGKLMNAHARNEIELCRDRNTLFRETSTPKGEMVKLFQQKLLGPMIGLDNIVNKQIVGKQLGQPEGELPRPTSIDADKTKKAVTNVMADLAKSAEANKTPPALKDFYQTIYKASIQKWGRVDGQPIKAVAGQVLLVGISPAITGSPKNSGYGNVEYGSVQNQLNGMVTAKVITNIANNTIPNDPKYNFVNQSFLDEQQSNIEKLVMNLMR